MINRHSTATVGCQTIGLGQMYVQTGRRDPGRQTGDGVGDLPRLPHAGSTREALVSRDDG